MRSNKVKTVIVRRLRIAFSNVLLLLHFLVLLPEFLSLICVVPTKPVISVCNESKLTLHEVCCFLQCVSIRQGELVFNKMV